MSAVSAAAPPSSRSFGDSIRHAATRVNDRFRAWIRSPFQQSGPLPSTAHRLTPTNPSWDDDDDDDLLPTALETTGPQPSVSSTPERSSATTTPAPSHRAPSILPSTSSTVTRAIANPRSSPTGTPVGFPAASIAERPSTASAASPAPPVSGRSSTAPPHNGGPSPRDILLTRRPLPSVPIVSPQMDTKTGFVMVGDEMRQIPPPPPLASNAWSRGGTEPGRGIGRVVFGGDPLPEAMLRHLALDSIPRWIAHAPPAPRVRVASDPLFDILQLALRGDPAPSPLSRAMQESWEMANRSLPGMQLPSRPPAPAVDWSKLTTRPVRLADDASRECSICQSSFQEGESLVLLSCRHAFHIDCLKPWTDGHSTCPNCRRDIQ